MGFLNNLTPVVKNLLLINLLFFVGQWAFASGLRIDLNEYLALHYVTSTHFGAWQIVSYMFMHGGFSHIFFNMFSLMIFGPLIEQRIGSSKFLMYYIVCGIGAGLTQIGAYAYEISQYSEAIDKVMNTPTVPAIQEFINTQGAFSMESGIKLQAFINTYNETLTSQGQASAASIARTFFPELQQLYIDSHATVGASGAVFGLLLAVAMIFPNLPMFLMFVPIPIKAKYFVAIYTVIELVFGVADFSFDNIAHWAHLGGMLYGLVILLYWRRRGEI